MARKLLYVPEQTVPDKLVKVTRFRNDTRSGVGMSANGTLMTGNFTKQYDANTSWILMEGMIPGGKNYSDQCGILAMLDGADTNNDTPRHHGVYYSGSNGGAVWDRYILYVHRIVDNTDAAQELNAGSRSFRVGWYPKNGDSGQRPFEVVNVNSTDDGRNQQYGSIMSIYEYLY